VKILTHLYKDSPTIMSASRERNSRVSCATTDSSPRRLSATPTANLRRQSQSASQGSQRRGAFPALPQCVQLPNPPFPQPSQDLAWARLQAKGARKRRQVFEMLESNMSTPVPRVRVGLYSIEFIGRVIVQKPVEIEHVSVVIDVAAPPRALGLVSQSTKITTDNEGSTQLSAPSLGPTNIIGYDGIPVAILRGLPRRMAFRLRLLNALS